MSFMMFEAKFGVFMESSTSLYELMTDRLIYMHANPVCILYQNRHNAMPQTQPKILSPSLLFAM